MIEKGRMVSVGCGGWIGASGLWLCWRLFLSEQGQDPNRPEQGDEEHQPHVKSIAHTQALEALRPLFFSGRCHGNDHQNAADPKVDGE